MQKLKIQFKIQNFLKLLIFYKFTFNFKLLTLNFSSGQSLIELLIAIGVSAILLPALITGLVSSREGKAQQSQRLVATGHLREVNEAVRSVRENGWATFAVNGTYYPEVSANAWVLTPCSPACPSLNGFIRQAVISDVYRDANGAIVQSGGTLDPSTKQIVTTISWTQPYASNITSTIYLTRWLENAAYTETTQAQFNAGTKTGVTVRATSASLIPDDGEIILGAGGRGNWCSPNLLEIELDLPGNGEATDITATEGRAYVGTGLDASGRDFVNVKISNPPSPANPVPSLDGTYDGNLKTNGVFGETIGSTSYAYLATNSNSQEVVILNASNNPPTLVSNINIPGPPSGDSVFVLNNILYVTASTSLYTYNISDRASPQPLSSISIPAVGKKVIVVGNYAYIVLNSTSSQLKIIDVTNPSSMVSLGQIQVNNSAGVDVFVNSSGERVFLVTSESSQKEFFIINTTNKNSPTLVSGGSYEMGSTNPKGVTVVPGNRAIVVGHSGFEYTVLNIDNENNPTLCAGFDVNENINAVSSVRESDGDVYSYILTSDDDEEFRIIAGGPGGAYADNGIFESQTFTPGYMTANNRLTATFSEPSGTDIQFQVALANLVGGVCPNTGGYTFVGPNGPSDKFNQASGEPITFPFVPYPPYYSNPGQCFRYKVFFTSSNGTSTPVLNDVTINYSP